MAPSIDDAIVIGTALAFALARGGARAAQSSVQECPA
jgi:hypothetical protein